LDEKTYALPSKYDFVKVIIYFFMDHTKLY